MRHGKSSFRHDSIQDSQTIRAILKSITSGLAEGKLKFSDGDDEIVMHPQGLLNLKLTATQEDDRQRVNIRLTWQVEEQTPKKNKVLSVSAK